MNEDNHSEPPIEGCTCCICKDRRRDEAIERALRITAEQDASDANVEAALASPRKSKESLLRLFS